MSLYGDVERLLVNDAELNLIVRPVADIHARSVIIGKAVSAGARVLEIKGVLVCVARA